MLREAIRVSLGRVFREETGRITAALLRAVGDFDLAEECTQEAMVLALETWPRDGIPERPGAWLTIAARRRALDRLRRSAVLRAKLQQLPDEPPPEAPDDRLRLIFTCCHPALAREAQIALTLRTICGLTTAEIARAFLVSEATMAQRIVRAKRKIVVAAIPYSVPGPEHLAERLREVLSVLYLLFNEGYLSASWEAGSRRPLAEDAEWLTSLLVRLLPGEPEAMGLLVLMRLHLARWAARFDADGEIVLLRDQDRSLWGRAQIARATSLLEEAAALRQPGPYQLQAAIAACHAEARSHAATDWAQVVLLYNGLLSHLDSPVVRLNRAIALGELAGPEAALAEVTQLAEPLDGYHLYHATRAELLRKLGREAEARAALERALELTLNPAERSLLHRKLAH
jgi:RNA polymerase sigma factor (sigma-70 family)